MKLSETDLEIYHSLTSRRARQADDCLDSGLLIRAAANDLTDAERADVVAHLRQCSDCARDYRVARLFRKLPQENRRTARRSWAVAAAALIAFMLPALVWLAIELQGRARTIADLEQRVERQRRQLASARVVQVTTPNANAITEVIRPQIDVPIVDLDASNDREKGTSLQSIVVPPATDVFTLILHLNHVPPSAVDIELANAKGGVVWRDHAASDGRSSYLTLALNRRAVPAGSYS